MSLFKNISIREKARIQLRLEAYNAFNHTEWSNFNSTATFNTFTSAGKITNLPDQVVGAKAGGRFGFGAENAVRAPRIVQIAAKIYF